MNPKKKPPAKPEPEPDEPLETRDDRDEDQDQDQDQPEPEQRGHHGSDADLKIVVKRDVVEIDLPRDGNETDTLERIANLVDEL